jgi:uncharacterized membrane protein YhaH (DUF805 family)
MQSPAPKELVRAISVFFYAMIGGIMIFTILISGLNFLQEPAIKDQSVTRIMFMAVLAIAAINISVAIRIYSKRLADIRSTNADLVTKLGSYRSALIIYLALCEMAGLFAVIVYFLTADKLLFIVIVVVLLAMLQKRPEKSKIFNELELSAEEQSELN